MREKNLGPAVAADRGSVDHLLASAKDRGEARDRLLDDKGIGDTTARILLDGVPDDLYGTA